MDVENLTPSQRYAVQSVDENLIVSAGAGSGKTRVLVKRFAKLLVDGLADLEEIVAITFTNKAALEMKQRIREELNQLIREDHPDKQRLQTIVRRIEQAQISTVHSLCYHLLKDYPLESGINPRVELLDEVENQLFLEDCLHAVVDEGIQEQADWMMNLYLTYNGDGFLEDVLKLYGKIRGSGIGIKQVRDTTLGEFPDSRHSLADGIDRLDVVVGRLENLMETEKLTSSTIEKIHRLGGVWGKYKQIVRDLLSQPKQLAFVDWQELKGSFDKRVSAVVKPLLEEVEQGIKSLEQVSVDIKGQEVVGWLFTLLLTLDQRYNRWKQDKQCLDFNDLELLTLRLFANHREIVADCQQRFKYIMVDEVQDTNPVQEQLIRYLTCDEKGQLLPQKLFAVGDPKQSIYRFRGADVQVFQRLMKEIVGQGGFYQELETNFRSKEGLIHFFNHLFPLVMKGEAGKHPFEADYSPLAYGGKDGDKGPSVELLMCKGDGDETAGELRETEAVTIADRIITLVEEGQQGKVEGEKAGRIGYGDIAILLRSTTDIILYEQGLRKRNVPYVTTVGRGFYHRQEVKDLVNMGRFLLNPRDELSLTAVLRSPFFGLADTSLFWMKQHGGIAEVIQEGKQIEGVDGIEQEKLLFASQCIHQLLEEANYLTPTQLLRRAIELTGYEQVMLTQVNGGQIRANIHKLMDMTEMLEKRGLSTLREIVRYFTRLFKRQQREGEAEIVRDDQDAVTLMTVHGSKGLEFPIVIVPDLGRRLPQDTGLFLFEAPLGFGVKIMNGNMEYKGTGQYQSIKETIEKMERAESYRVLYVALTRAQDYLIVSGIDSKPLSLPRGVQPQPYSEELAATIIHHTGDWLSWLKASIGYIEGIMDEVQGQQIISCGQGGFVLIHVPSDNDKIVEKMGDPVKEEQQLVDRRHLSFPLLPPVQCEEQLGVGVFSPTSLVTYLECPRRFYFSYRLYMPELEGGDHGKEQPASILPPQVRGNIVHRFCEQYEEGMNMSHQLVKCIQEEGIGPDWIGSAFDQCRPLVEGYLASELYGEIKNARAVYSEWPFHYRQGRFHVRGKIDKLIVTGEGIQIIDFKTNRIGLGDLHQEGERYRLQIELYCLAASRILKQTVSSGILYFLTPNLVYKHPFSIQREEEVSQELYRIGEGASREGVDQFPRSEGQCRYCGYTRLCQQLP